MGNNDNEISSDMSMVSKHSEDSLEKGFSDKTPPWYKTSGQKLKKILQNIRINLIFNLFSTFWKRWNITNAHNIPVVPKCQFKCENPSIYIFVFRWFLHFIDSLVYHHLIDILPYPLNQFGWKYKMCCLDKLNCMNIIHV